MPVFWGDGRNYAGNRLYKSGPDGLTLYLRHGQIAVAMDVELYNPASTEGKTTKAKISRYVLSGDLIAGRVQQTIPWTGQTVSAKSYYHLDHLNSTKLITKEDGTAEVQYVYRAFGEQLRKLGSGDATYTYGGKELDDNTNLYYFNARFYDATTGRFINVDPIQDGTNWYVYCSNNPLNFKDPTGLDFTKSASFWTGVGGTAAGIVAAFVCPPAGIAGWILTIGSGAAGVASIGTAINEDSENTKQIKDLIDRNNYLTTRSNLFELKSKILDPTKTDSVKTMVFEKALSAKQMAEGKKMQSEIQDALAHGKSPTISSNQVGEYIRKNVSLTDQEKKAAWNEFNSEVNRQIEACGKDYEDFQKKNSSLDTISKDEKKVNTKESQ